MDHFNYGVVGNCRTAALVSDKGSIDWFCFPDFDSPSIFARVLDEEKGGYFAFVVENHYSVSQKYIDSTNILTTTFNAIEGGFEVIDFMPIYRIDEQNNYFLPPEIYRVIRVKHGTPRFRVVYKPALNYARDESVNLIGPEFVKTYSVQNESDTIYLYSGLDFEKILNGEEFMLVKDEFLLLSNNQKLIRIDQNRVELELQRTRVYWMNWTNRSRKYSLYNDMIQRSILILKLMSYHRTGAVLAALTTSIPESIGEVRNWDYRFCWLRDASMSIETLLKIGHRGTAQRFMNFIKNILKSKSDTFQIMYGIRGERILTEIELDHLSGYKDSRPVRIGNAAYSQKQNDSFGYLMDVIYQYYLYFPGTLDEIEDMFEVVKNIVKTVIDNWREPDKSIWEIRGEEQHFVFSKIMCWVAMDRAVSIARMLYKDVFTTKWQEVADSIKFEVLTQGWKEELQSFSQTYENNDLDASLLLLETYGFISPGDERYRKTVDAVYKNLNNNGLMFRYQNQDDFGIPTTAFTICSFWMVRALYVVGRTEEAQKLFDDLIRYSNHLGLFSEDLDFETKSQLGNFPQAYSHLALINTAMLFTTEEQRSRFIKP